MTRDQFDRLYSLLAVLANVERLDASGEPNTLSLEEIQEIGSYGLDLMDGSAGQLAA